MSEVTDPAILAQLNGDSGASSGSKEVTDPDVLAQLNGEKKDDSGGFMHQLGRQTALTGRALLEAPAQIAALPSDAVTSAVNFAKHPHVPSLNEFNPLATPEHKEGDWIPASEQISKAYDQVLPHPESGPEKVAYGVESFLAGAKTPMGARALPAAAKAAESTSTLNTVRSAIANKGTTLPSVIEKNLPKGPNTPVPGEIRINPEAREKLEAKASKNAKAAVEKLEKAAGEENTRLSNLTDKVKEDRKLGVPTTLADTSDRMATTAKVAAQKPGPSESILAKNRIGTQKDAQIRVPAQARKLLGANGDAGIFERDVTKMRSDNATKNYEAVRQDSTPVLDPDIYHILENPLIAKIYQDARGLHMEERSLRTTAGKPSPPLADIYAPMQGHAPHEPGRQNSHALPPPSGEPQWVRTGTAPDVKSMDYLIRSIQDEIDKRFADGRGGTAKELKAIKSQLKERMNDISPAYERASKTYGDDSAVKDAYTSGLKDYLNKTPEAAAADVKKMSDSEKTALRMGVAERLLKNPESTNRNVDIGGISLGGERQQKILRAMFDNDADFEIFKKVMEAESKIHQNHAYITKGSDTFKKLAAAQDFTDKSKAEDLGKIAMMVNLVGKGWLGTGLKAFTHMIAGQRWNNSKAEWAARILSSKDPEALIKRIQAMDKQVSGGRASTATAIAKGVTAAQPQNHLSTVDNSQYPSTLGGQQ